TPSPSPSGPRLRTGPTRPGQRWRRSKPAPSSSPSRGANAPSRGQAGPLMLRSIPTTVEAPMRTTSTSRRRPLARLGAAAAAHPWRTLAIWLFILVATVGLGSTVGGQTHDDYNVPGTRSQAGTDLLAARFPELSG